MQPIYLNRATLKDKITACWLGKNIGGTMGGPFEGRTEIQDIQGFTTPKGQALPNDDLDLQLVWLKALEERGSKGITPQVLGEYWISNIPPFWNEYGIGKANLQMGIIPPLSGHLNNLWKDSNGAWIRSEIWACCTPGAPDLAIQYAYCDACVDHGMGEGTYAELFTASVESAAFVVQDPDSLIRIGLSKIPENCRVAQSIRVVLDAKKAGRTWQEAREEVLKDAEDLGWFQAPANVAYVIIGLLWGEGDFKKSMIIAIDCGDDTDCTGATIGSLFGIMGGTAVIPPDWAEYIGDEILTVACNRGCYWTIPKTCTELTNRTMLACEAMLLSNPYFNVHLTDGKNILPALEKNTFCDNTEARKLWARAPYSFDTDLVSAVATVEFDKAPVIAPGETLSLRLRLTNKMEEQRNVYLRWILPEGWTISGPGKLFVQNISRYTTTQGEAEFVLTAGETVEPVNRLILEAVPQGRPTVGLVSVTIFR